MKFKIGDIVELDESFSLNTHPLFTEAFYKYTGSNKYFKITAYTENGCVGLNDHGDRYDEHRFKISKAHLIKQIIKDL